MRLAIIGVGGVGGSLGAALLQAGHEVLFIARGENAGTLAERGLTVKHERLPFHAGKIDITSNPDGRAPAEAALLCVKRYDLIDAIETHAGWLASCGSVVTLQNGLDAQETAAELLPTDRTLGGTVQVVAKLLEPGVILREGETLQLNLAEPSGGVSERLRSLEHALAPTGIQAEIHRNMETMLWLKFLMVACSSSINVAIRSGFDAMASNPAMPWLLEIALQEALAVARAREVPLPHDIEPQTRATLRNVFAHGGKASLLTDLERGRPLEIEWLSGAIHRMGEETGVPTPLHTAIYRELLPLANGLPE
ncbi:MAG: 2-dehydropantoate 2-reductase [Gammaproteobacteria bacterium]|nr:2-dehydropantoate 2-reductase [Gammaproteobacteria bacterium]